MKKIRFLLPPLHGIAICAMCFGSFTWAWFSASADNEGNKISAATYGAQIEVSGTGAGFETVSGYGIQIEEGKRYDIRITATGSAPKGGYCIVSAGDDVCHTVQMIPEDTLTFSVCFPGSGTRYVEFIPSWGTYRVEISAGDKVANGSLVSPGDAVVFNRIVSTGDEETVSESR